MRRITVHTICISTVESRATMLFARFWILDHYMRKNVRTPLLRKRKRYRWARAHDILFQNNKQAQFG